MQSGEDRFENSGQVVVDVLVVEAENLVTELSQMRLAPCVVCEFFWRRVRRAVDLDDKLAFATDKAAMYGPIGS